MIRYYSDFLGTNGTHYTVKIYKEGYEGDPEGLLLSGDPITIEYNKDEVISSFKLSGCTITVLTPDILKDIYTGKVLDSRIEIYKMVEADKGGSTIERPELIWWGYNSPNIYNSDWLTDYDQSEINGVDSLSALKYFKYYTDEYKEVSFYDVIKKCLDKVNPDVCQHLRYINSFNDYNESLKKFKVNEQVFFNEDDEPVSMYEAIEYICQFLGVQLVQYKDEYWMIENNRLPDNSKRISYYLYNGNTSEDYYTAKSPKARVGEESASISMGDVYNQVNIVANLRDVDQFISSPDFFDDKYLEPVGDLITFADSFQKDGKTHYRDYYLKNYVSKNCNYERATFTINREVVDSFSYADISGDEEGSIVGQVTVNNYNYSVNQDSYSLPYQVIKSCSHEGEDPFPHPAWSKYFSVDTQNYKITNLDELKVFNLTKDAFCIFHYLSPQSYSFLDAITENVYMTIDASVMLSDTYYYREEGYSQKSQQIEPKYFGFKLIDCVLKIGDKYWDGGAWGDTPIRFSIPVGDYEDTEIKTNQWLQFTDTTDFRLDLQIKGKQITIKPEDNINGQLEIWFYPNMDDLLLDYSVHYNLIHNGVDWAGYYWGDNVTGQVRFNEFKNNPTMFDAYLKQHTDFEQDQGSWGVVWYSVQAQLPYSYFLMKDINFQFQTRSGKFFFDKVDSELDFKYSRVIDEGNVEELSDITLYINTYNPIFNNPLSFSYVIDDNGEYLQDIYKDGYYVRPEEHLVRAYAEHYQNPKLIYNNILYTDGYTPFDGVYVESLGKTLLIGSISYNLRFNTSNIQAYEI